MIERTSVYCGSGRVLTRLRSGHKMYVDARDISLAPHLILDGYWEDWITAEVLKSVRPGMSVVEVGANCGYYTVLMADALGPQGRLTTLEANPEMAALVRANISINGFGERVQIVEAAACEESGVQTFYRFRDHKGGSSLTDVRGVAESLHDTVEMIQVPGIRIDDLVNWPIDFMRIDAEGAEARILRGASESLRRSRKLKIIMEFTSNRAEIADLLGQHGFRIAPILPGKPIEYQSVDAILRMGPSDVLASR